MFGHTSAGDQVFFQKGTKMNEDQEKNWEKLWEEMTVEALTKGTSFLKLQLSKAGFVASRVPVEDILEAHGVKTKNQERE